MAGRTLPRVRELKRTDTPFIVRRNEGRTLPRVRELKQSALARTAQRRASHPSQGA